MRRNSSAFTRLELLAVIFGLFLLATFALPLLAATRRDSDRVACFNNLRQIGRAVELWAGDHEGEPPWRTYTSLGGTRPASISKPGNAWFEFTALSNELFTPRILACPADAGVKVASEFSSDGQRGYMSTGFRAAATSYFVRLDTAVGPDPTWFLAGDHNIRFFGVQNCVYGVTGADIYEPRNPASGWTNAVHGAQGNAVRTDGGVSETTSEQFRTVFFTGLGDDNSLHFLRAR